MGCGSTSHFSQRATMKIILYVLAAIGAVAVIAYLGMWILHGPMMRGMM
jgi:hypothetical protein